MTNHIDDLDNIEANIQQLGQLRDRLQRLEETDYMIAYHKGYSNSGATLDEVQAEMAALIEEIAVLESRIEDTAW